MLAAGGPSGFAVRSIRWCDGAVVLEAEGTAAAASCPDCGAVSEQVHARYARHPFELPWRGSAVRLALTVRRFACPNPGCARRTFAEGFGPRLPRYAQRTDGASELLLVFGLAAGGEAGARLAEAVGLPASPDTLLRLVRQHSDSGAETPRVLGVDDLSLRRGVNYATLLVNMETHRPVDLLAGRDAEVLAAWLREHPGVEIIVRDRSEAYAQGGWDGAPEAQQVADRFHLVKNAGDALDELMRGRRRSLSYVEETPVPPPGPGAEPRPLSPSGQQQAARRAARLARWERVRALHAAGASYSQIAREVGIDRKTVARLVRTPEPPRNRGEHRRPADLSSPSLAPYAEYLKDRWQAGCHNISQLYREIEAQGYARSRSLVAQALLPWRPPRPPPGTRRKVRRLSARWLCLRPPDQLKPYEAEALAGLLAEDPELDAGYRLLQHFRRLIAERDQPGLDAWLADARASGLPTFASLANGIAADRAAVDAALTTPWSNGMVEGFVHKVKLIKRQGYGRAGLRLLRARVLAA
jgi:transposase